MSIEIGFRPQPGQTGPIDSSLNSVSTGIQAAAQSSGLGEISDWIDGFSGSTAPIDAKQAGNIADSSAIPSPDSYFKGASRLGGEAGLQNFSDLVPMDEVSGKLSDPSFDQQKGLQRLSSALSQIDVPVQTKSGESQGTESYAGIRRIDEQGSGPTESQGVIPFVGTDATESQGAIPMVGSGATESESASAIPAVGMPNDVSSISFLGDIGAPGLQDSTATLTRENAESVLQNAGVFQRLTNLQDTLQNIVSLNQQTEGK